MYNTIGIIQEQKSNNDTESKFHEKIQQTNKFINRNQGEHENIDNFGNLKKSLNH